MTAAEQHSCGDVGGASVDPMDDMMSITAVRERPTPRKDTPPITTCQRSALVAGEEPFGPPEIQRDTEGVEDHRPHIQITHQRAQCLATVRNVEPVVHDVRHLPVEHQRRFRTRRTPTDTTPRTHPTTRRSGGSGSGLGGRPVVVESAAGTGDRGAAAQFLQRQRAQRRPARDRDLTTRRIGVSSPQPVQLVSGLFRQRLSGRG